MGTFTRGDVVLFPFPYTDLSQRKLRPCLVLSGEMGEDILLCQITSQRIHRDQYAIELKPQETTGGSLLIDSYIRANMIFTAHIGQIKKRLCVVSDEKYRQVVDTIMTLIRK